MQIALELSLDYDVVLDWPKSKFELWHAFFRIREERSKKGSR
jgi:hypothetical protein